MPSIGNTPRPAYVYDTETDTWVPIGVGAHTHDDLYVNQNIIDAKGDLLVGTADNSYARLAKGADGTVLVADNTTQTGLAWQPYGAPVAAGKNFIINGLFDIWQRSTDVTNSLSMGTFYAAADRWQNWVGTSCNTRYQRISNADPGVSQYSYRIQRVAGVTTATNYQFSQNIETSMAKLLVGKTVTLSFRVKKGANWSDADGTMSARVAYNDNTDGNVITQAATTAFSNTFTPTTSFATYSVTGTIPSSGVSTIMVNFFWEPTGTAGADDWLEFSAVQLELGSTATPFSRAGGNLAGELAACQRYYVRYTGGRTYSSYGQGFGRSSGSADILFNSPVEMRSVPTAIDYSNIILNIPGGAGVAITGITSGDQNTPRIGVCNVVATITAGQNYFITNNNNTAGYIGFSAEL